MSKITKNEVATDFSGIIVQFGINSTQIYFRVQSHSPQWYCLPRYTNQPWCTMARASARYAAQLVQLHGKWTQTVMCAKYARKIALMRPTFWAIKLENRARIERAHSVLFRVFGSKKWLVVPSGVRPCDWWTVFETNLLHDVTKCTPATYIHGGVVAPQLYFIDKLSPECLLSFAGCQRVLRVF